MGLKEVFASATAFALTAAPALAQATVERASSPLEAGSEMGGSSLLIIALVVALGIGIYLITDDNNSPDSP
jgi:hypothetical protein